MKRLFGRGIAPDPRDANYPINFKRSQRTYRYWNSYRWRGDQLATPQCVGFSWAHWLSSLPMNQFVYPDGIYTFAKYLDEWQGEDYDGTSVRAGAQALRKLGFIHEFRWAPDLVTVLNALLEIGPVVAGTYWLEGMLETDRNGYIHADGNSLGGHAYMLDGVNVKTSKIRMKNSWGQGWGNAGYAWIGFADFEALLADNGEVCIGVEQRPAG